MTVGYVLRSAAADSLIRAMSRHPHEPDFCQGLAALLDRYRAAPAARPRTTHSRDARIRPALREFVRQRHGRRGGIRLVDEFAVERGHVRIDLAVLNGRLHGYEIKSAADRLDRLEQQAAGYSSVFDTVTLVTEQRHLEQALAIIPSWWGIMLAKEAPDGGFSLRTIRRAARNPRVDALRLAELLWKNETIAVLKQAGAGRISTRRGRNELWLQLAQTLSLSRLRHEVLVTLRHRRGWRAASIPA